MTAAQEQTPAPDAFTRPVVLGHEQRLPPSGGPVRLANFLAAPRATQTRFFERIARAVSARHYNSAIRECEATDFYPSPETLDRLSAALGLKGARLRVAPFPEWDQRWRDRAYSDRLAEERGRRVDPDFDTDKARLLTIPAEEYVERLLGEDVPRSGMIHCPRPAHDERTPSCRVRDLHWHCFGCDQGGSIYDLAGELWGLDRQGAQFMEIHKRLVEVFR